MSILYDTAAALAMTAEDLADAIDDQRTGWPVLAETARALLGALTCAASAARRPVDRLAGQRADPVARPG